MADIREARLTVGEISTRILTSGPEHGEEAVVFVHGAPGDALVWKRLQSDIGDFTRTVAFDLPGYGLADQPATFPHTMDAYAEFVGRVIESLGISRAHLVMNDIGGAALKWAADNPEVFASSIQIDTGIINQLKRWHLVGLLFRTPVIGALGERFGRLFLGPTLWLYDPLPRDIRRDLQEGFNAGQRRALRRMYRSVPVDVGRELSPRLASLDRPALVIWGKRDRFVPFGQADQRTAFPEAQVELLVNSGHYPHLDAPHDVAELVVPFLRSHVGP